MLIVDPDGRHPRETVVVQRGQRLLEVLQVLRRARRGAEEVPSVGVGSRRHTATVYPQGEFKLAGSHHHLFRAEFQAPGLYHGGAINPVIREYHDEERQIEADCRREY